MPVLELVTSSGLGSLLGMRHAFEPDHLAAVSTLVTRERNGQKSTTKYTGTLKEDTITGKSEGQRGGQAQSNDWVAKRQK